MRKKNQKSFSYRNYEKDLEKIIRYPKFDVMFYRTDLKIHVQRIIAMLEELLPFILTMHPELDVYKLFWMVWFHDAPELITGDVSLQAKLVMSQGELTELSNREELAIEIIFDSYSREDFFGYNIKDLMLEAKEKKTLISQLASFVDKVDGFCEAFHELLAGNNVFAEPVWNYPLETFGHLKDKYPLLVNLFHSDHFFFQKHIGCLQGFYQKGRIAPKPHDKETVTRKTEFPHYEFWKSVTIKNFGIEKLIVQKEFFDA
ncbi:MAG: YfbR-like 5'-deoxynucleotidase [bacterium]